VLLALANAVVPISMDDRSFHLEAHYRLGHGDLVETSAHVSPRRDDQDSRRISLWPG